MNAPYPTKRPVRFFNTTGPCDPCDHYMLPPADRLIGAQLDRYIRDKLYWVLHAPRQTGKTTFLLSWARELNAGGEVAACYVTVEACQGVLEQDKAMRTMHSAICLSAKVFDLPVPALSLDHPENLLSETMRKWAELVAPKPLVVLFDEVDVMEGDAMISFLRQLRGGFANRGVGKFPISIALVGMRDLKDYITAAKDGAKPNPGSPFNIKTDSVFISNFSKDDVAALFAQRTVETGQQITDDALEYIWEQSWGQPWIVNSLFNRATIRVLDSNDYSTVTVEHIKTAREQMILARETHLDALAFRLKDPGIRKMMETLVAGTIDLDLAESDACRQCLDLGLIRMDGSVPVVANPIYREVLARQITVGPQAMIPAPEEQTGWQWLLPDGRLDMDGLLRAFQSFWRENSEEWEEISNYTEAFPHILLMAFLQRILNGGGRIEREYAAGRGRMDIFIEHNDQKFIIEIKMVHPKKSPDTTKTEGLWQIAKYRGAKAPGAPSYLVIFDRRQSAREKSWDERIAWTTEGGVAVLWC